MRVLFIASQPFFQWRGSPIRLGFDVRALVANGCEVDFLTLPVGERCDIPGVRIVRAPNLIGIRQVPIGPSFSKVVFDAVFFCMALGMALRRRYAVIHGVEDAGPVALAVARLTGARAVFEKHSDPASHKAGGLKNRVLAAYAAVERFTIRHVDAVIGTGPGLVEQARQACPGVRACHIPDIPSSLVEPDSAATARARARLQRGADDVLVTYVGSFAVYQGIDLMFEAIPLALRLQPRARFVIIGGTPRQVAERTAWLRQRAVDDRVTFAGTIAPDALPDYLAASDILLSPRVSGVNTPLKLLDYLKVGRAIVATDVPANRLILDAGTALLVAPEPRALAEGIAALVGDAERREGLGRRGRRLIDETYNFGEFRRRLGACYADLEKGHDHA